MLFIWSICSPDKYFLNETQGSGTMAEEQDQGAPHLQGTQSSNGGFSLLDEWGELNLSEEFGGIGGALKRPTQSASSVGTFKVTVCRDSKNTTFWIKGTL